MSELSQVIEQMRNMRESYDQIGAAAEAYNTGKVQLAENITSKGVQASASESLPELAEKVMAISQDTYIIDGGEMYAKQMFGSLTTPNYWNLYEVLEMLLSDGRLVNYGGILLAEYYRGYDSFALAGAGAGGAYVVSDLDENEQFKMYIENTTHTWATEFDGKGNRWVAYCFADEYQDFQITDTNTSPRSIFIGRKVGTITSLVNGRVSQIVVPDGNELRNFNPGTHTQNWAPRVVVRNITNQSGTFIYGDLTGIDSLYVQTNRISAPITVSSNGMSCTAIFDVVSITGSILNVGSNKTFSGSVLIRAHSINTSTLLGGYNTHIGNQNGNCIIEAEYIRSTMLGSSGGTYMLYKNIDIKTEDCVLNCGGGDSGRTERIHLMYFEGYDKAKSVKLGFNICPNLTDIELQDGWCKLLDVSGNKSLTETNMYAHILQRLKQDEPDCGSGVTITLGSTNLAKLTSQESIDLLAELRGTYGYTFA